MSIVVGVDTHKKTHTLVVLKGIGEEVDAFSIPATPEGYRIARQRVKEQSDDSIWGIEGAYTYGQGLAEYLTSESLVVYEVPGSVSRRHRRQSAKHGKSDPLDARAIAEATILDATQLPRYERSAEREAVRLLYERRDRLVRQRTEAINRTRAHAHHIGLPEAPANLGRQSGIDRMRTLLDSYQSGDVATEIRVEEIRDSLGEIEKLSVRIAELEHRLRPFVERLAPALLDIYGASVVVAAGLIGHAGSMNNCRDAHAFAMRAGTAPIPCWSGNTSTVRLNRGGNRQLNRLLHNIAITQLRKPTHCGRHYYDRKRNEGKSHRAAIRSLKRQLATVVFYKLRPSNSTGNFRIAA